MNEAQPKAPNPGAEIAPAWRDYDLFAGYIQPQRGGRKLLVNPDEVLRSESRGRGIRLYEDLERDPHLYACLASRKLAVAGQEWRLIPAGNSDAGTEQAYVLTDILRRANLRQGITGLLDAILKGFAVCELMWEVRAERVILADILPRAQHRFIFDDSGAPRLLTPESPIDGEPLPGRKFAVFAFGSKTGSPYGSGLGRTLFWPVWFKKHGLKYWMIFAERFGSPTVVGKYPPGASPEQQRALLEAISAIQQETGIKVPDTMDISLLEAVRSSSVNTYADLMAFMNAEVSKVVLGQTLTTQEGQTGSLALGRVHAEVRADIIRADSMALAESLSRQVVRWLSEFNFPGMEPPRFEFVQPDSRPGLEEVRRDAVLAGELGLPIARKYLYAKYDIPEPGPEDALVGDAQGPVQQEGGE